MRGRAAALGGLALLGLGSVVALASEGPLPCGVDLSGAADAFCARWVAAPGDSCDPVRPFLPEVATDKTR